MSLLDLATITLCLLALVAVFSLLVWATTGRTMLGKVRAWRYRRAERRLARCMTILDEHEARMLTWAYMSEAAIKQDAVMLYGSLERCRLRLEAERDWAIEQSPKLRAWLFDHRDWKHEST